MTEVIHLADVRAARAAGPSANGAQVTDDDDLVDARGAAALLSMSRDWIYKRTAEGTIPFRRMGGALRFVSAELIKWRDAQGVTVEQAIRATPTTRRRRKS